MCIRDRINTGPTDVNQTLTVGGSDISLVVPKNTLRVQVGLIGRPAQITLLGQRLSAVVVVTQTKTAAGTKVVRMAFTDVNLFLGDDKGTAETTDDIGVNLTDGSGALLLTPAGFAGEFDGDVAFVAPAGFPVQLSACLLYKSRCV